MTGKALKEGRNVSQQHIRNYGFEFAISACLLEAVQLQIRGCQAVLGVHRRRERANTNGLINSTPPSKPLRLTYGALLSKLLDLHANSQDGGL